MDQKEGRSKKCPYITFYLFINIMMLIIIIILSTWHGMACWSVGPMDAIAIHFISLTIRLNWMSPFFLCVFFVWAPIEGKKHRTNSQQEWQMREKLQGKCVKRAQKKYINKWTIARSRAGTPAHLSTNIHISMFIY